MLDRLADASQTTVEATAERGPTGRLEGLIARAKTQPPLPTAVVHPVDTVSLVGAVAAAQERLITPVLVGPEARIRAAACVCGVDLSRYELVSTEHSDAAAKASVQLARSGRVSAVMKGALHTDELLRAVLDAEQGLRSGRRISHVFVVDTARYPRLLLITDAAINISPGLEEKRDIVQNAIDLAQVLGISTPNVAILSAIETINPKIRSTLDAAALCKMADRGQITGGVLDGPLGFDNAISAEAARTKGIVSAVSGSADILVVPDIEAGNMLVKQLEYLDGAHLGGIVLGARVPIMLTSRADGTLERLASCAIGVLLQARAARQ